MSHSYPSGINREQFARILPTLESARRQAVAEEGVVHSQGERGICG